MAKQEKKKIIQTTMEAINKNMSLPYIPHSQESRPEHLMENLKIHYIGT
jgi:hypothetical protein